jgi:HEAT repeat protein
VKSLSSLLNIQPGEGQLIGLMFGHYFLMNIAFHFTQTAAFAIFLANFDAQNLPYTYIINAITITLLVTGYLRLSRQFTFATMLTLNLGLLLTLTVLFAAGIPLGLGWLLFLLPTLFELTVQLGNLEFWSLAGSLFDLRQSKRLFGLIGSGGWIAVILGGLLTPALVALIGTANLLWISAVGLMGTVALLLVTTRIFAPQLSRQSDETTTSQQATAVTGLFKNRYVLLIFAMVSLWWFAFYFLDNIFLVRTAERFPEEAELASFLGLFFGAFGLVALLVSLGLTGPIIGRFGVRRGVQILPVVLLIGSLLMIILGFVPGLFLLLFWVTAASRLLHMAVGFTLDRAVLNILYQPLPVSQRVRAKTTAEGIFLPLAIGFSGLTLLFFNNVLAVNVNFLTIVLFLTVAGWTTASVLIAWEYPSVLLKALTRLRIRGTDLPLDDSSSQAVLRQALQNPHPQVALYALNQLAQISPADFGQYVPVLLAHPAAEVRRETLCRVEQLALTSVLETVREQLLVENVVEVKTAALQTLATLGREDAVEEIYPFLDSPELLLKAAAIVGLLKQGNVEVTIMAEAKLLQLSMAPDPIERMAAAQIIGQVKAHNLAQSLNTLLQDEAVEVCRVALAAAGEARYSPLWPQVIKCLAERKTRQAAQAALIAGDTEAVEAITLALANEQQPHEQRLRLFYVCGRIGGSQVISLLLDHLSKTTADSLRTEIVMALHRCDYQASLSEQIVIQDQLKNEAAFAGWLLNGLLDLEEVALGQAGLALAAWSLLYEALQSRFRHTQERLLLLFSFLGQREAILGAKDNLLGNSAPDKRTYALEIIELSTPAALRPLLLPLLEPLSPAERLARLGSIVTSSPTTAQERLPEFITDQHAWTAACALYIVTTLEEYTSDSLVQAVRARQGDDSPLVSEMAALALAHFAPA